MGEPAASRSLQLAESSGIGEWNVHASANLLRRIDETVKLEPKTMQVLLYLAQRVGQTVAREQLEEGVWRRSCIGGRDGRENPK